MCCVLELQFHDQSPVTDHLNFSGLAFGALHGMIEVRSSAIFFWDDDIGNLTDDVYLASLGNVRVSCPRWQHIAVQYHTSRMVELIFSPLSFSSWLTICLVTLVSLGPDHKALLGFTVTSQEDMYNSLSLRIIFKSSNLSTDNFRDNISNKLSVKSFIFNTIYLL